MFPVNSFANSMHNHTIDSNHTHSNATLEHQNYTGNSTANNIYKAWEEDFEHTFPSVYKDSVADVMNIKKEDSKINMYHFYGEGCHACNENIKMLEDIKNAYPEYVNLYTFETWYNTDNAKLLDDAATPLGYNKGDGVPITIVNDTLFVGFADFQKVKIEDIVKGFIDNLKNPVSSVSPSVSSSPNSSITSAITSAPNNNYDLPILGTIDTKTVSIPLATAVLGFVDGFNPCAMWVLILLISLFLGMKDRKKSWILGITFLFISALMYFLSMFGINYLVNIFNYVWLKSLVAVFILIAGILNFRKYLKTRKDDAGCNVVDDKKRKSVISKARNIVSEKNLIPALIGIIVLAVSVNSLELLCSLGFPMVFAEILSLNEITGITRILYTLLYVLFYMMDDIAVFSISMVTMKATGITNKYNKLCTLVSSIIMIVIAILLIVKPAWLMLNF